MLVPTFFGRSFSHAVERLLPGSLLSRTTFVAAQSANRLASGRAQCEAAKDDNKEEDKKESMWSNPECCLDPCPDVEKRFDDLYYKPSDKLKRKYTQTWVECPNVRIVRKKICCAQNIIPPPFERRNHKAKKKAQEQCQSRPTDLMPCQKPSPKGECPKLILPHCRPARDPAKCLRQRYKVKCNKICTPYPSYSECSKKIRLPTYVECRCLDVPSLCEVWRERRRQLSKKRLSKE